MQKAYLKAIAKIGYWEQITKESPTAIDILESFKRKLKALECFMKDIPKPKEQGGKKNYGETQKPKRDLGRTRPLRTSQLARDRIR